MLQSKLSQETDIELGEIENFFKSVGFSKKKSCLYASSLVFDHGLNNFNDLENLIKENKLENVLQTMKISDSDMNMITIYLKLGSITNT